MKMYLGPKDIFKNASCCETELEGVGLIPTVGLLFTSAKLVKTMIFIISVKVGLVLVLFFLFSQNKSL